MAVTVNSSSTLINRYNMFLFNSRLLPAILILNYILYQKLKNGGILSLRLHVKSIPFIISPSDSFIIHGNNTEIEPD